MEKLLEKKLSAKIKALQGLALKLNPATYTGLPDRLILLPNGKVCFAEIKTSGKKPSRLQLNVHKKLKKLGFTVFIIDSEATLREVLRWCLNHTHTSVIA